MEEKLTLPENFKIVDLSAGPVTTNGAVTSDYVSMKNVRRATVIASFTQAVGHATVLAVTQATAVDGTGVKALAKSVPIWMNADTAAADTLVRQTDAVSQALGATIKKHQVVVQIDAEKLDVANGFDCLGVTASDSSQATNFVNVVVLLEMRYQQATPPAAITD